LIRQHQVIYGGCLSGWPLYIRRSLHVDDVVQMLFRPSSHPASGRDASMLERGMCEISPTQAASSLHLLATLFQAPCLFVCALRAPAPSPSLLFSNHTLLSVLFAIPASRCSTHCNSDNRFAVLKFADAPAGSSTPRRSYQADELQGRWLRRHDVCAPEGASRS
jgi:hypothetical protein